MTEQPLDDDEKLASLMKQLPQRPLPPGFMQRLERRRRAERAPEPRPAAFLLPFPARVAAFALSSLIVSLVIYDKVRVMFPVPMVSGAAAEAHLPSVALSQSDVEQARAKGTGRRLLRARGEPFDAAAGPRADAKKDAGPWATNEELQAGLERQKREMGMRAIVAPPPPELAAAMKLRAGVDAELLKTSPPAPKLGDAGTPALLAEPEAAPAPARRAAKMAVAKAAPAERGSAIAADSLSAADMQAFAEAGASAPAAPAAAAAAPAAGEGLVLKTAEERGKAWNDHGLHAAPPSVNFNANMIALVVAPDMSTAVEIVGVSTRADRVVVSYRLFPRLSEVASAARSGGLVRAYQFRVIPRTDKPVVFSRAD